MCTHTSEIFKWTNLGTQTMKHVHTNTMFWNCECANYPSIFLLLYPWKVITKLCSTTVRQEKQGKVYLNRKTSEPWFNKLSRWRHGTSPGMAARLPVWAAVSKCKIKLERITQRTNKTRIVQTKINITMQTKQNKQTRIQNTTSKPSLLSSSLMFPIGSWFLYLHWLEN